MTNNFLVFRPQQVGIASIDLPRHFPDGNRAVLVSNDDDSKKMQFRILQNCSGAVGIAANITVYGATEKEQDRNLNTLMKKSMAQRPVFNSNKCYIKKTDITLFLVMFFGRQGI